MPTPGSGQRITIELLDKKRHDRSNFSCGVPTLDAYLQRQAAQDMEKHAAKHCSSMLFTDLCSKAITSLLQV